MFFEDFFLVLERRAHISAIKYKKLIKYIQILSRLLTRKGSELDGHRFFPDHFKNVLGAILIRLK